MRFSLSFAPVLALVSLASAASEPHGLRIRNRHLNRHADKQSLEKRGFSGRFTYYADGQGACGSTNTPGDFIVALNSAQYGSGQNCFQTITITYNGKSAQAQIVDECPGCGYGDLDFSQGLFQHFADTSVGEIYGTWEFGSGAAATTSSSSTWTPTTTSTTPTPTPTTTWTPTTTSTWTPPTTSSTSTWTPPTTSTTPTSTPTHTSTTPTSTSTSTSSASSTTSSTVTPTTTQSKLESAVSSSATVSLSGTAIAIGPAESASASDPETLEALNTSLLQMAFLIGKAFSK